VTGDDAVLTTALSYTREASAWHAGAVKDRSAWRESYDRLGKLVTPDGLVLDLGCGGGDDVPALASMGLRSVGLDISAGLLVLTRRHKALVGRAVLGDLRSLPFAEGTFDAVWADGSVHHVTKAEARGVASEVVRVLKPGGVFGLSVALGMHDGFVSGRDGVKGRRWYSYFEPDELRAILRRAGIDVVDAMFGAPSEQASVGFVVLFARRR
jgi:SAM-dependent methyltransferase